MKITIILLISAFLHNTAFGQEKEIYQLPSGPKDPGKFHILSTQKSMQIIH